jgi:hypothetical protein
MTVLLDVGLTETIDASHVGVIALPDIDGLRQGLADRSRKS